MKILCVSDHIDPLVYSDSIKERFANVDMILSAGDLPLDYLDFIVTNLNRPLFFIQGNHVDGMNGSDPYSFGAAHLDSKIRKESGLIVAGLGGSIRYNRGPNQFTEFQMYGKIAKLIPTLLWNRIFRGRYLDILLTHAPPKGINDRPDKCHSGFNAFLWFIKKFKPKYHIHGHVHLYDLSDVRCTKYKNTEVINTYNHYVLEVADLAMSQTSRGHRPCGRRPCGLAGRSKKWKIWE